MPMTSPLHFNHQLKHRCYHHCHHHYNDSGFGLLGVVFIIFFIALMTTGVVMTTAPSISASRNRETEEKGNAIVQAIRGYRVNHGGASGTLPPNLAALVTDEGDPCALDNTTTNVTYLTLQGWCGPYLDQVVNENLNDYKTDGWGTEMTYDAGTGLVTSCGPDRTCGNADDLTYQP